MMLKAKKIDPVRKQKPLTDRSVVLELDLSNPKVLHAFAKAGEATRKFRKDLEEGRRHARVLIEAQRIHEAKKYFQNLNKK